MSSSSKMHNKDVVSVDRSYWRKHFKWNIWQVNPTWNKIHLMGIYLLTFTKFVQWFGILYFKKKKRGKLEKEEREKDNKAIQVTWR